MRTVTTLPSATEIVAALGREPVGVSHECDYPPAAADAPAITRSRLEVDESASSGEIDQQVLETADTEAGVYDIDVETLDALEPDAIVTQGMCDVCAVDVAVIEDAVARIDASPEIVPTDPHSVGDVLDDIERIGAAIDRQQQASELRADLEARLEAIRERTADIPPEDRPRVAILDWTDPAMVAGHWTAELVDWAGGEYGLADAGERSRPREWEEIRAYDPEVLIVAPCGFGLEQIAQNATDLTERDGWAELTAVREGRVWAMDGDHYLNRPGPRLVDTLEALAPIVHPERFDGPDPAVAVPFDDLEADVPGSESVQGDPRAEVDSGP
ncbi:periplasmic binding protein [Natrinema pellirubrum DSM 15624]|uniref:ABC-type Fe3+-hydroxamate transport system, periplasmic component n=1 Tax=Natrinema pellirubrum (strain DSM 15624 / CIP 106293 / JCM 10476 / NCIMB 786 / 157) TaxID=797303 RepID=L0JFU1_NATP1|nr:ABC transporter substrate-binding protein [Natrinema pellirubrum]AGB30385.1 ABC-type Fe3+-hydroxamate transport system, periplasmic component [Natrinema pellirubrum DSM 15624]ELY79387.1 periplasmic binding protein [Natrinema pellirubrum DSM 15624]